ncbi:MAG: NAD(P)-dependent alcohol dehydrogenase [Erythrobacter sp.]|nr:MAG: NAD(P)-dependent alcohol dehydrogenase [Erythrobacter sp.]
MTTTANAAICRGHDHPFSIEPVELADLAPDEILVRVIACGICHTDLAVRDAQLPVPLPAVLGHEGAGIVEAVGNAVTAAKPGDRVVMSFNSCGSCPSCEIDAPTYCYNFFPNNWSGTRADGTPCMRHNGEPMAANFFGQSAFATHAIAHQNNTVALPSRFDSISLDMIAPIGCGLMTGAGAVLNAMEVREGMPIAVFGTGTVGMAAIMAAKIAGANPIIAVDVNDARLELAKELGATHAFNAKDDAPAKIRELCPHGLGYAFDTTGINKVIEDGWNLLAPKGICGIVGASDPADNLTFNEAAFMGGGRTVMGILGGNSNGAPFLLELLDHHLAGNFPFDRLIEHFDFAQINEAIEASEAGLVVKPVLRISAE